MRSFFIHVTHIWGCYYVLVELLKINDLARLGSRNFDSPNAKFQSKFPKAASKGRPDSETLERTAKPVGFHSHIELF